MVLHVSDEDSDVFERVGYWTLGMSMVSQKRMVKKKAKLRDILAVERELDLAPKTVITIV